MQIIPSGHTAGSALYRAGALISVFAVVLVCTAISTGNKTRSEAKYGNHPVYAPDITDIEKLKASVESLMKLSPDEVIAEVPAAANILYLGCPNCSGGSEEGERQRWHWEPGMGATVRCNYCGMVFPNEKFPDNREKVIIAPSGAKQVYRYYENPNGRTYYFEAHTWNIRSRRLQTMAEQLARLWFATRDNSYGDRAAAIAGRFAQVFPDWAVHFDYPNTPVRFFPADQRWPYEGLQPYRGSKWSDWGYHDIPASFVNVYDILQAGYDWKRMDTLIGPGTDRRIENDLLRLAYDFTTANPEIYSNMSPGMYRDMLRLGRIVGDPAMVHEAVKRFREFFSMRFFADGWWNEGTTSYHNQTIGGLKTVSDAIKGYTDPAGWRGERFENPDLAKGIPLYDKALQIQTDAVLPDGRPLPVNDTWGRSRGAKTGHTVSHLWPSLGDAVLGTGEGDDQIMLNVNWSGNYGHSHYDNGSIILYAAGEELLSDIGYTHTKYRGWTIHTASHNTVVIDQAEQDKGRSAAGRLMFYDDTDPHVKVIDVDASPAYPQAKIYRRRLILVHTAPGRDYIVDRFDVEGGEDHDWFLHGMCEQEGTLVTSIPADNPVGTLVPDWGGKNIPEQQSDTDPKRFHAYTYLRDIREGRASEEWWTAIWKYDRAGLCTHIFSPAGTRIFRFRSPSIRPADEDGNRLDNYMSAGIIQRHSGKTSVFTAVHEPFRDAPWIESIQAINGTLVIRYSLNNKKAEDKVFLNNDEVKVTSSEGWRYYSGGRHSGNVEALEYDDGKWILRLDQKVPEVKYIRLELSDGGTRYYPVRTVRGRLLELEDDPGFTLDKKSGMVSFHTFPQDKHAMPLRYSIFEGPPGEKTDAPGPSATIQAPIPAHTALMTSLLPPCRPGSCRWPGSH
jgi:hypothetical protein